ncbi:MAG: ABC transporter permease [Verrucomicrobiae bacterium]|nr:ABC transporter permease [Verrucomicrobiae bacterium]
MPSSPHDRGAPERRLATCRRMLRAMLLIGHNDLRMFLRNRALVVWLFVMPVAFVFFMGFANRGPGAPSAPRPSVLVENLDEGPLGSVFLEGLGAQGLDVLPPSDAAGARRGIRVPADFSRTIRAGRQGLVETFTVKGIEEDPASALVALRVARALIAMNSDLVELAAAHPGEPADAGALRALRERPPVVRLESAFAGRRPAPSGFGFSLPGVMVMYLMMNLLVFGGTTVSGERRSGVLRRIGTLPVGRGALVLGKIHGLMLLAIVQVGVLLLAGRYLFHVPMGGAPVALLLVLMTYAWVAASLGVLIGSLVRAEDKVVGLCVLVSLVMAALGGCWWPIELVPPALQQVAHALPTGWAMDALHQLITFGSGWSGIRQPLLVLFGFGAAANLAAIRCFRS